LKLLEEADTVKDLKKLIKDLLSNRESFIQSIISLSQEIDELENEKIMKTLLNIQARLSKIETKLGL